MISVLQELTLRCLEFCHPDLFLYYSVSVFVCLQALTPQLVMSGVLAFSCGKCSVLVPPLTKVSQITRPEKKWMLVGLNVYLKFIINR